MYLFSARCQHQAGEQIPVFLGYQRMRMRECVILKAEAESIREIFVVVSKNKQDADLISQNV
jgi:hypothetical protein